MYNDDFSRIVQQTEVILNGVVKDFRDTVLIREVMTDDGQTVLGLSTANRRMATLELKAVYKGKIKKGSAYIFTGTGRGDCGYDFTVGKTYIIYGHWQKQLINEQGDTTQLVFTDICTRTNVFGRNEEKAIKQELKKHPTPHIPHSP